MIYDFFNYYKFFYNFINFKKSLYIGNKLGLIDKPSENKIHTNNVSLLGGLILFVSLLIFLSINYKGQNFIFSIFLYSIFFYFRAN